MESYEGLIYFFLRVIRISVTLVWKVNWGARLKLYERKKFVMRHE